MCNENEYRSADPAQAWMRDEHLTVRNEINLNARIQGSLVLASSVTTAVVIGAALIQRSGYACLAPLFVQLPCLYWYVYKWLSGIKLETYMQAFFEETGQGLGRISMYYNYRKEVRGSRISRVQIMTSGTFVGPSLVCLVLAYLLWEGPLLPFWIGCAASLVLMAGALVLYFTEDVTRDKNLRRWRELRDEKLAKPAGVA